MKYGIGRIYQKLSGVKFIKGEMNFYPTLHTASQ